MQGTGALLMSIYRPFMTAHGSSALRPCLFFTQSPAVILSLSGWCCIRLWLSASAFFSAYFRVYSPITFGKKYDPEGLYIKRFIPALKVHYGKYPGIPITFAVARRIHVACIPHTLFCHLRITPRSIFTNLGKHHWLIRRCVCMISTVAV